MSLEKKSETCYKVLVFYWEIRGVGHECAVYDKTYAQALEIAKLSGYKERKWFNPRTWHNGLMSIGIHN